MTTKIELCTVGGFSEVGRNMTAVKVNNTSVICDMGLNVQKVVEYEQTGKQRANLGREGMQRIQAVPDDNAIKSWRDQVKGIFLTHCHLDHIGAVHTLAKQYRAPIFGTSFTNEVLKHSLRNDKIEIPNKVCEVPVNGTVNINKDVEVEFIDMPHSTLQTSMLAIHTPKGVVLYATDYKFDETPVMGKRVDYSRLKELGQIGVRALVLDGLYSRREGKMESERVARGKLKDAFYGYNNDGVAIVASCFASHIARIKSIMECAQRLNRKVVLFGRSFYRYTTAAQDCRLAPFLKNAELYGYATQIKRKLRQIEKEGPEKYVIICTGGQGEENAVLSRILRNEYQFKFCAEDQMIFSNSVIPVEPNMKNRQAMEVQLKHLGVQVFKDLHVSGHGAQEDIRETIRLTNPEHIIPCHGFRKIIEPTSGIAEDLGYKVDRDVHVVKNGTKIKIP